MCRPKNLHPWERPSWNYTWYRWEFAELSASPGQATSEPVFLDRAGFPFASNDRAESNLRKLHQRRRRKMNEQTTTPTELDKSVPQISFLDRLADQLAPRANASAVFGEPVERDGVTIIPVAKATWGMGGGSQNRRDGAQEQPTGGGGGLAVRPMGFIEVGSGTAKFRMIRDSADVVRLAAAAGIFGVSLVNAIARLRAANRPTFRPMFPGWRGLRRALRR
jgi:uncharacterized spore protein YtfJ